MNSNKNKQNWFDNNPFFDNKEGYENFAKVMITAAKEGHIPIILKHEKPEPMTSTDIKLFAQRFKRDTGLSIEFKFSICNQCDRLHCFLIVDEFPENEVENDDIPKIKRHYATISITENQTEPYMRCQP